MRGLVLGGVVLVVVAAVWWGTTARPQEEAGPCRLAGAPAALPDLPEASGLAISRRTPGLLWAHNDSGNAEILFALDPSGAVRGRVRVPVRARDWEDVSAGPCPLGDCLYIADIGDNAFERRSVALYRVPEPSPGDAQTARPEEFRLFYADGRHNAEAAFVLDGRLFIVTKDRTGGLYRSTAKLETAADVRLERVGELGLPAVTDAEASPDEALVVVRTSHETVFYRADELARGTVAPRLTVPLDGLAEPQGEGVALDANGLLYLVSEGRAWTGGGSLLALRCDMRLDDARSLSSQVSEKPL